MKIENKAKMLMIFASVAFSSVANVAPQHKVSKKVLLIGVDGIQYEKMLEVPTPNLDSLNIIKAYTGGKLNTATQQATFSGPSWSTILTGVWANKHKVTDNNTPTADHNYPSVFKVLFQNGKSSSALIAWPEPLRNYFTYDQPLLDYTYYPDYDRKDLNQYKITDQKISYMFENLKLKYNSDFVFVHFDQADDIAHELGFSNKYREAIENLDTYIGRLINTVKKSPNEDWLVLVVTDHGRSLESGGKTHGGQTSNERTVWIASNKKLYTTNGEASLADITPTIYDYLNIKDKPILDGSSLLSK
ncbi:alkaline phosphatase family protein [uncultured Shewanella sp.]|uniref:alkaline phosphatase family protein n=1 Tax=uncultured Shewanella sp. TaxID=173975 RepID=UPI002619303F|nr:alkaline phosphatase family protein [uncultured Shewanella sp.]